MTQAKWSKALKEEGYISEVEELQEKIIKNVYWPCLKHQGQKRCFNYYKQLKN
jgi:ribosomal protein S8